MAKIKYVELNNSVSMDTIWPVLLATGFGYEHKHLENFYFN